MFAVLNMLCRSIQGTAALMQIFESGFEVKLLQMKVILNEVENGGLCFFKYTRN